MTNLDDIADVLRAAGVTVHETPDWDTRGYAGQDLVEVRGVLWHHTATNRAQYAISAFPTVGLCVNGRSDLPGPLCNLVFGRDGSVTVIATGVANHAGRGSAPGVPKDMGNHYLIGIEMESSGIAPWDWTPAQIHWAPIVGAALEHHYLAWLPEDERLQLGHLEYSSEGKIDPAGWPGGLDGLRAAINDVLAGRGAITTQSSTPAPAAPPAPAPIEGDDMLVLAQDPGSAEPDKVWISNIITRRHVSNPKELDDLRKMHGWGILKLYDGGKVQSLPLATLGVEVKAG